MTVYLTAEELKATLTLTGTTFRDGDVESAIIAASGQVERMTNRDFGQDLSHEVRYYTARDPRRLIVHDFVSIEELVTDDNADGTFETTWATTDYTLLPFNAEADAEPYTELRIPRFGTKDFPTNVMRGVKITAVWGWPEVPQQVVEVTSIIAAQLIMRKVDAPFGFVIGPEAAAYISRSDPTIQGQLHDLNRKKLQAE